MTYQELKTIILRMAKGSQAGGDQYLGLGMLHELVLNARAFILMKMTSNGRELESSVVQRLENIILRPLPLTTLGLESVAEQFTPKNAAVNRENNTLYYQQLYYADLPSELLHFSNMRALRDVSSIDQTVSCAIIEQESIRAQDDELFPGIMNFAWVNRKKLFIRLKSASTDDFSVYSNDGLSVIADKESYPTGSDLYYNNNGISTLMPLRMATVAGVFRDPVAAGGHTGAGGNDDLSEVEINLPAEYTDLLINQVYKAYIAPSMQTVPENILDGRRDDKPQQPQD